MKRLFQAVGVLLLVVLAVVAGLQIWFSTYKVSDPARIAQIEADAVQRIRERDQLVTNPAQNHFAKYEKLFYDKAAGQAWTDRVRAFNSYSPQVEGKPIDLTGMLAHPTPDFVTARDTFESILPEIADLLESPHIVFTSQYDLGPEAKLPNFLLIRSIHQNLGGYVQFLLASGRTEEALRYALLSYESSGKWGEGGPLISGMIGLAVHRIAIADLKQVVMSGKLTREQLERALSGVRAGALDPRLMVERLDEEFAAFQMQFLNIAMNDPNRFQTPDFQAIARLRYIPGYLQRERRLIQQLYLEDRDYVEKLEDFPPGQMADHDQRIRNAKSLFAETFYPSLEKANYQFRLTLDSDRALELMTMLELYRLDHRSYPDTLEQLVPAGGAEAVQELPRDVLTKDGKFAYQREGASFTLATSYSTTTGLPEDRTFWPTRYPK